MRARVYTHRQHWPSQAARPVGADSRLKARAGPFLSAVGVKVAHLTQDLVVAEELDERFDISITVKLLERGVDCSMTLCMYKPYPSRARRHVRLAHRHIPLVTEDTGTSPPCLLRDEPHRCGGHLPATGRRTTGLW